MGKGFGKGRAIKEAIDPIRAEDVGKPQSDGDSFVFGEKEGKLIGPNAREENAKNGNEFPSVDDPHPHEGKGANGIMAHWGIERIDVVAKVPKENVARRDAIEPVPPTIDQIVDIGAVPGDVVPRSNKLRVFEPNDKWQKASREHQKKRKGGLQKR